jgi:hypothetical protein
MTGSFKGHLPWTMCYFPQGDHEPDHGNHISHRAANPEDEIDSSTTHDGFKSTVSSWP